MEVKQDRLKRKGKNENMDSGEGGGGGHVVGFCCCWEAAAVATVAGGPSRALRRLSASRPRPDRTDTAKLESPGMPSSSP